ncbi:putative caspase-like protein [Neobacillus bataviensis]|uniref:Putative caspase-like protein n=1 Tax=Neobacillus bataviensis TaxID=220685 RepID=A0A561DZF7_9BACI|nr:caspase family protein [Neobacillus bataviensis]TWE08741.1 putative caspase-like protein [Neobacillus bataviensis]
MSILYRTTYTNSWALVIGINEYKNVNNLSYACNDAVAIAKILKETYQFPEENVTLLLDEDASKANIMSMFLKFANDKVQVDDRIIIFYAGHGHTMMGRRGDIGYLVPHDGSPDDLSTFIRWDDLTKNSELIRAKHILYIMDACYSGLAITRSLQPGSVRFLRDMLKRNSRQVLTAGKANEVVADSNGPIPGHSIFTGHLVQALEGNASNGDGVLTANGVMSYIYEKVSNDMYSEQTPHYGFLEGDGDFIFKAPILENLPEVEEVETDYLIEIPAVLQERSIKKIEEIIEETKEFLTESKSRIKLDELVNYELRKVIMLLTDEHFPVVGVQVNAENFVDRLSKYENTAKSICSITSSIAHWGQNEHAPIINRVLTRLSESNELRGGTEPWLSLRWYPILLVMYSGGISALANENYEFLARILITKIREEQRESNKEIVIRAISEITNINEAFKMIPEHERHFVPRSEYLYKILQPDLDELLFLGKSYDELFDRFEIFLGLVYADLYSDERIWGPIGRFGWKYHRSNNNILAEIVKESEMFQETWAPLKAGLFRGSYERFRLIARKFEELISRQGFY